MRQSLTFILLLVTIEFVISADFECKKDGLYPNPANKHRYIECAGGRAFNRDCAIGTMFNVTAQECVTDDGITDKPENVTTVTTAPPTKPTAPPTKPTDPPTKPTAPPTKPTDPPTKPTDPPTKPTDPPTKPTAPPTKPTDPPTKPTLPPTKPTDPPTKPTDPPTKPTLPPTKPTDPPTKPTDPPTKPTAPPTTRSPNQDWETMRLRIENDLFHLSQYMKNVIHDANQLINDPKPDSIKLIKIDIDKKISSIEQLEKELAVELAKSHTADDKWFLEESLDTLALDKKGLHELQNKLKN